MESTYRRSRYTRYNSHTRHKKQKEEGDFIKNLFRQIVACCIIFAVIFFLKNTNQPFAHVILNQINSALAYNVNINNAYKSVETFVDNTGLLNQKNNNSPQSTSTPQPSQEENKQGNNQQTESQNQSVQSQNAANDNNAKPQSSTAQQNNAAVPEETANVKLNQVITVPLQGAVTSKFGMRIHPLDGQKKFHYGIDIDASKGTPIAAAMDGEVEEVSFSEANGKYIKLKHQDDVHTVYAHCSEIDVKKGQNVKMKEVIGKVGDTGAALGAHLHFEIWRQGKVMDPLKFIQLPLAPSAEKTI